MQAELDELPPLTQQSHGDGPQRQGPQLHLRDTYPAETAWAPAWVGDELRQVRRGAQDAKLAAIRTQAEAATARRSRRDATVDRHDALAASYRAMAAAYDERENVQARNDRVGYAPGQELLRRAAKFMADLGAHPEVAETRKPDAYAALMIPGGLLHAFGPREGWGNTPKRS